MCGVHWKKVLLTFTCATIIHLKFQDEPKVNVVLIAFETLRLRYTPSLNAQIRSFDISDFLARLFTFTLDTTGIRYLCLH